MRPTRFFTNAALLSTLLFGLPQQAVALTFVVDDTADAVDAVPGDCVCATAGATCTLRAAVQEANACAGFDVITVPAGTYVLTLPGGAENAAATGDLDITSGVRIVGNSSANTTIDASGLMGGDRVFDINGATTTLQRLHITGGNARFGAGLRNRGGSVTLRGTLIDDNVASQSGGGIRNTGANANMTLSNTEVSNNSATGNGGGISNVSDAVLNLEGSDVRDNFAGNAGGGIHNTSAGIVDIQLADISDNQAGGASSQGGGIANINGWLTVYDATIDRNVAGGGGGIYHHEESFFTETDLTFVTLEGNQATGSAGGGGLFAHDGDLSVNLSTIELNSATTSDGGGMAIEMDTNTLSVLQSSIIGNDAADNGGGVYLVASTGSAGLITRSVVAGNEATMGGGLFVIMGGSANVTLSNDTISGNSASGTGGGMWLSAQLGDTVGLNWLTVTANDANVGGGVYPANNQGQYAAHHMLLAENTAGTGPDCDGAAMTSLGFNLLGTDQDCSFPGLGSDLVGIGSPVDPELGPLQDNGGPTWTHELLQSSPAIDLGAINCSAGNDQRNLNRPVNVRCDTGAFEVQ